MKLVISALVAIVLLAGGYCWFFSGSARVDAAKKNVLERLDHMLGKLDVQKADVDNGTRAIKHAIEGVRKAKIKAQVRADQIDEKVKPFQEKIAQHDQSLAKLRDLLTAGQPAVIAGKTYTVDELHGMANTVIQSRRDAENQISSLNAAHDKMQQVVATLTRQQETLESRHGKLQGQIAALDAELGAAKSMKEASSLMDGEKYATLAANLDSLEEKVAGLTADVRSEVKSETDRWFDANKALSQVDALIRALQGPTGTLAEIDRILGPAKSVNPAKNVEPAPK